MMASTTTEQAGSPPSWWMLSVFRERRERVTLTVVAGASIGIFALFAALQAAVIHGMELADGRSDPGWNLAVRLVVNGTCVLLVVAFAALGGMERRRPLPQVLLVVLFSASAAGLRLVLQIVFGIYEGTPAGPILVDFATALVVTAASFALALGVVVLQRRLHEQEQAFVEQQVRASAALAALQGEELRVRREVSEGLHGTVQQRLVLIGSRLAALARDLDEAPDLHAARLLVERLEGLADEVDSLREVDVRELSQLLYPSGIELGLAQAVRMMMRKVPSTIETRVDVDEAVLAVDDPDASRLTPALRLLLVRVVEEAVTNALRHGHASRLEVRLGASDDAVRLVFEDDGLGLPEPAPSLNGLGLLGDRLREHGGSLALGPGARGGARLEATLPLR